MSEPVFVALLFADKVIVENNGKKGIIGTFTTFNSGSFPAAFPPWGIYAAVTNLTGKHTFALNLVHDESNQVVVPISGEINAVDRSALVEITPVVHNVTFSQPGAYTLTFHIDGALMGTRILYVHQADNPN